MDRQEARQLLGVEEDVRDEELVLIYRTILPYLDSKVYHVADKFKLCIDERKTRVDKAFGLLASQKTTRRAMAHLSDKEAHEITVRAHITGINLVRIDLTTGFDNQSDLRNYAAISLVAGITLGVFVRTRVMSLLVIAIVAFVIGLVFTVRSQNHVNALRRELDGLATQREGYQHELEELQGL